MPQWNFQPDLNVKESILGNQLEVQHWEVAEISGYPIKFIKAEHTENNDIFNEGTARSFLDSNGYTMRSLRSDDTVYGGTELFGSFGYSAGYNDVIYVPIKYFKDIDLLPDERDLVFDDVQDIVYEITKVDTLNETQESLRINDRLFSYKIYLKRYSKFYKDSFDTVQDDIFTPEFNNEVLDELNSDLQQAITDLDVEDNTEIDEIFADFK
jgi:hypothetical protein